MKTVFMGTPDFAVLALRALMSRHEVAAVFTQQDKPKGRGHQLVAPPVKQCALEEGIPVYQPGTLRDGSALSILEKIRPEVIVVAAYGKILPKEILTLPRFGCINIHASLLPKYRGAAPIHRAVLNGDPVTGVTTMQMAEGLDTGDMLLQAQLPVSEEDTTVTLFEKLSELGARLLLDTLDGIESGTVHPRPQDEDSATYASMITKDMAPIDWSRPAEEISRQVRGLQPWPVASTLYRGQPMKITRAKPCEGVPAPAGTLLPGKRMIVSCGKNTALELLEVQLQGGKRLTQAQFLCGHPVTEPVMLGS